MHTHVKHTCLIPFSYCGIFRWNLETLYSIFNQLKHIKKASDFIQNFLLFLFWNLSLFTVLMCLEHFPEIRFYSTNLSLKKEYHFLAFHTISLYVYFCCKNFDLWQPVWWYSLWISKSFLPVSSQSEKRHTWLRPWRHSSVKLSFLLLWNPSILKWHSRLHFPSLVFCFSIIPEI